MQLVRRDMHLRKPCQPKYRLEISVDDGTQRRILDRALRRDPALRVEFHRRSNLTQVRNDFL